MEVCRSLESDDFSHITATYYLLAERVLASYREERARKAHEAKRLSLCDLPPDFNSAEIRFFHFFETSVLLKFELLELKLNDEVLKI